MGNRGREGPWSPAPALSLVTAVFLAGSWAALPSHRVLPEHHVSAETGAIFVQALEQERFQEAFVAGREDDGGERARGVLQGLGELGGHWLVPAPRGREQGPVTLPCWDQWDGKGGRGLPAAQPGSTCVPVPVSVPTRPCVSVPSSCPCHVPSAPQRPPRPAAVAAVRPARPPPARLPLRLPHGRRAGHPRHRGRCHAHDPCRGDMGAGCHGGLSSTRRCWRTTGTPTRRWHSASSSPSSLRQVGAVHP